MSLNYNFYVIIQLMSVINMIISNSHFIVILESQLCAKYRDNSNARRCSRSRVATILERHRRLAAGVHLTSTRLGLGTSSPEPLEIQG